jgi:hypothetical protein
MKTIATDPQTESTAPHLWKFVPGNMPAAMNPGDETATIVIARAAAQCAASAPEPVVVPRGLGQSLPPASLLGVVSYAYAKGICRSEEIEHAMSKDSAFRAATGDDFPDPQGIRRFRRLNRAAIVATLEKFFRWRRRKEMQAGVMGDGAAGLASVIVGREMAAACLDHAAMIDQFSRDED